MQQCVYLDGGGAHLIPAFFLRGFHESGMRGGLPVRKLEQIQVSFRGSGKDTYSYVTHMTCRVREKLSSSPG